MLYLHGITRARRRLLEIYHRLARIFAGIPEHLIAEYRQAPFTPADETGWRTNDHHGDAWLFAPPRLSLFLFRQTRAASVPQRAFGNDWLPGCLVVDRYNS